MFKEVTTNDLDYKISGKNIFQMEIYILGSFRTIILMVREFWCILTHINGCSVTLRDRN